MTSSILKVIEGQDYLIGAAGRVYLTGADVSQSCIGPGQFSLTCQPHGTLPPNDECDNAIRVNVGKTLFDPTNATNRPYDHTTISRAYHDLWYSYTAPCAGHVTIATR